MLLGFCGLNCETCPIHLATLEQDSPKQWAMRVGIARICTEQYGMALSPQDVTDCDGCRRKNGRLFPGCARCEIRTCAQQRDLTSCAFCVDYACEKLLKHFETDPSARIRLESLRPN